MSLEILLKRDDIPEDAKGILRKEIDRIKKSVQKSKVDFKERNYSKKTLTESGEKFSQAFHRLGSLMTISTLDTGKLVDVSDYFCDFLGYRREEVIGKTTQELDIFYDYNQRQEILTKMAKEGFFRNVEVNIRTKTRKIRYCLFSGDIIQLEGNKYLIVVANDITDRKKAEKALKESEAKFSTAFHRLGTLMTISTLDRGEMVDVSDFFCEFLGYRREEVIGKTNQELNLFYDYEQRQLLITKLRKEGSFRNIEVKINTKTREIRYCLFSGDIIQLEGKEFLLIVANDITERKKLEQLRIDFVSMTSHELRTPLTVLKGYGSFLEKNFEKIGVYQIKLIISNLNKSILRLERLIQGVGEVTRIEKNIFQLEKKPISIHKFLDDEAKKHQITLGNQLTVNVGAFDTVFHVEVDRNRLQQVLDNLIDNAVKHTNPRKREISLVGELYSKSFRILVSDNGAGIKKEILDKIFGQFTSFSTDYHSSGTGIGLYLSRKIIEAHEGTLTVHSEGTNCGATFLIEIPR